MSRSLRSVARVGRMAAMLAAIVPAGFATAADVPVDAARTVPALTPIHIARPRYQTMQRGPFAPITNAATTPQCADSSGFPTPCDGTTMLQVMYFGGKVVPNAKVYAVFWTSDVDNTTKANIGLFYQALTNSTWMDWLTEYSTVGISGGSNQGIGRGTYAGSFTITPVSPPRTCEADSLGFPPPPGTICIWNTDIPAELDAQITAGNLPMPDPHTVYMFHFPPTHEIQSVDRTNISDACVEYCAFHSTYARSGFGSVYYGVFPDLSVGLCPIGCGSLSPFDNLSAAASHELGEAMTDAEVGLVGNTLGPPLGWYDGATMSQGEIGDMCNQSTDTITAPGSTTMYTVQNMFSKVIWDALKQPTTLACVSRRFATNDYTVFFNPNTQSLASGGNVSIPIHLETTNGTASSVTISVSPLSTFPAGVHATPSQTSLLSMPPGSMPVANLNITVDPGTAAAADLVVVLSATSGAVAHSASVLLQVVPATPMASSNSPVCAGSAINLSTPTLAGATYAWTGPNGFTSSQQNPTISNTAAANAGTYSVMVTVNKRTSAAGTTTVTVSTSPATPVITAPANGVSGATGLTASVPSHPGSTYAWSITNGAITSGQGTNQLTFTAGLSGTLSLGVIETNGCASPQATSSVAIVGPPQNVVATASSSTAVDVSWLPNGGSPTYEVMRLEQGGAFTPVGTTTALSFNNNTNVSVNKAYLYAVRAIDSANNRTANSKADLATTFVFTDDPLVAQSTAIKAPHFTQLRNAVEAVRALGGLQPFVFTDLTLNGGAAIRSVDVSELRTALDQARAALMLLPPLTYTDSVLTSIKAVDVRELRDGVK
jgi:hypothetical protein